MGYRSRLHSITGRREMHQVTEMEKRESIDGFDDLTELALNFFWGWHQNHAADKIWKQLDPELWDQLRNPWAILQSVSREKLKLLLSLPPFRKTVKELLASSRKELSTPGWFQKKYPSSPLTSVAYFSMEFMLGESLPIYSGGLGNVAGDQLKAASDLGVPVIGIGLLYQQGYFRQVINKDGSQQALYPFNDPGQLPITPLRKANGEWLRIEISLPGWSVWLRTWEVKVGRVKLYLLDSNDPINFPAHRGITSELYGGDAELRLKQELVLGMGGWRLLEALGFHPEVCHLNEGHAAFVILERTRSFMEKTGLPFKTALAAVRAGILFTTHTAVPAGFDRFPPYLIEQYLASYAREKLGISLEELLAFGRENPSNKNEEFNMAYLAIRGSGAINGVSALHGRVSRHIFSSLFPRHPIEEVPVKHVTNGIHMPSWSSIEAGDLWKTTCGENCWNGLSEQLEKKISGASDEQIWEMRTRGRKELIDYARGRLSRIWEARGFPKEEVERAKFLFDPSIFTIGFARRFATYKRPNLLLHDTKRLLRILSNPQAPAQLLIAGKAHPADKGGQAMIQEWVRLFQDPIAKTHITFLTDYDMLVTKNLVQGVDLWVNTPRRPWEACGTSGMKILANGGINLSELDGWWVEAYDPKLGFAIGDKEEHGSDPVWDAAEANRLYDLLEFEIIPEFYSRNSEGFPSKWIQRIRESMSHLSPLFSADRTVREYTETYYIKGAENYLKRSANKGHLAAELVQAHDLVKQNWHNIRFGEFQMETTKTEHLVKLYLYLNGLDPRLLRVELYANNKPAIEMECLRSLPGDSSTFLYQASLPATENMSLYTPRVLPHLPPLAPTLETSEILWQR